jgi:predicted nucleotide-binding protein
MIKRSVMMCDDQKRFLDEFVQRHRSYYDIQTIDDARKLLEAIEQRPSLPDILLLDLYHPSDSNSDFEERRSEAEASLAELDLQIEKTKQAVLHAWEPHGLDMLEEIRRKYTASELPIAIFTQKGLLLLDDEQLRKAEQLEGHWLLKRKLSARTEEIRIDRIIDYYQNRRRSSSRRVFIIHGHDNENLLRLRLALTDRYKLEPVILRELPGSGKTIIAKLEEAARGAVFAIALLTPDDFVKSDVSEYVQARPNVLFELGYFYGLLNRSKVCILCQKNTAIPSDLHGVSRIEFSASVDEALNELDNELRAVGLFE